MRVLRISHSGVVGDWRHRERAIAALGVDLHLVSADVWDEAGAPVRLEPLPDEAVEGIADHRFAPRPLPLRPAAVMAAAGPELGSPGPARGALRAGHGRDPRAARAASPAGALRRLLGPEPREAAPRPVPAAPAARAARGRWGQRVQRRGRRDPPATRVPGPTGRDPSGSRRPRRGRRPAVARPGRRVCRSPGRPQGCRRTAGRGGRHAGGPPQAGWSRSRGGRAARPQQGGRPRRQGRLRGLADRGRAHRVLPQRGRARGAVTDDRLVDGAVRARRRGGHGGRDAGRRVGQRGAAGRRRRRRPARAPRRRAGPGRRPDPRAHRRPAGRAPDGRRVRLGPLVRLGRRRPALRRPLRARRSPGRVRDQRTSRSSSSPTARRTT